jgi:nucleoside-diphosphate-sugar epimerase
MIQLESSERELNLIHSVKGRILKYISLGSIAEIEDSEISPSNTTLYSDVKKKILIELQESGIPYLWIRLASIYGQNDNRDWLMNQLIDQARSARRIEVKFPNQLLNLCHSDSVAQEILEIQETRKDAALNFYTSQWVTVAELANSFALCQEPKVSPVSSTFFSKNDPFGHLVHTPPILDFIRASIDHE